MDTDKKFRFHILIEREGDEAPTPISFAELMELILSYPIITDTPNETEFPTTIQKHIRYVEERIYRRY